MSYFKLAKNQKGLSIKAKVDGKHLVYVLSHPPIICSFSQCHLYGLSSYCVSISVTTTRPTVSRLAWTAALGIIRLGLAKPTARVDSEPVDISTFLYRASQRYICTGRPTVWEKSHNRYGVWYKNCHCVLWGHHEGLSTSPCRHHHLLQPKLGQWC